MTQAVLPPYGVRMVSGVRGKVFGVGWAKTGTTTLGQCLEILGYSHVGGRLDLVDHLKTDDLSPVIDVAGQYDSAEDWPWLLLYRELDEAFPGSRFVLTTRDTAALVRSYRNMVAAQISSDSLDRRREVLYGFAPSRATDADISARIEAHNAAVRRYFAAEPEKLLEVDWSRSDGWPELCDFLGLPIPDAPFPRANAGTYNPARHALSRLGARAVRAVSKLGR